MKTRDEIMSAPADEVAKVLVEFNKWRCGKAPYDDTEKCQAFLNEYCGCVLALYIDRAVELLNQKGEQT